MGEYGATVNFDVSGTLEYIEIKADKNVEDHVENIVHELVHVALSEMFQWRVDETLEEVMVLALASYMYNYVKASKIRRHRWVTIIERKFAESDTRPEKPLSELVERNDPT